MKNNNSIITALIVAFVAASIVAFAIMSTGCGAAYRAKRCRALNCCPAIKDSTHIIDSTYIIPVPYTINGDTAWLSILAECDSAGNAHYQLYQYYQGKYIEMAADTSGDTATIHSWLPARVDTVRVQGRVRTEFRDKAYPVITNVLTKWQKIFNTLGWIFSGLLVFGLLYLLYKIVRKFV